MSGRFQIIIFQHVQEKSKNNKRKHYEVDAIYFKYFEETFFNITLPLYIHFKRTNKF